MRAAKRLTMMLLALLLCAACTGQPSSLARGEGGTFTAIIVPYTVDIALDDLALLVEDIDDPAFEHLVVHYGDYAECDFAPAVGQRVRITASPGILQTEPAQVFAARMELVK